MPKYFGRFSNIFLIYGRLTVVYFNKNIKSNKINNHIFHSVVGIETISNSFLRPVLTRNKLKNDIWVTSELLNE